MTQVDAVEESDRCDGWFVDEWERPDPADHVHGRRAYTPCAPVPPRGNLGRVRPVEGALKRRPGEVTFAGWLMGINGVLSAIGGVIVLLVASNTREMTRHGLPQGALLVTGFVVLTLGLLELLLVYALFGGSNAARIITTVVFGVSLLFSFTSVLTRQPGALFAWVTGLVDVVVLVGLWGTPGAAEFFDPGRAPSTRAAPSVPPPPRL